MEAQNPFIRALPSRPDLPKTHLLTTCLMLMLLAWDVNTQTRPE